MLTKDELIKEVWGGVNVDESNLSVYVGELKKVLPVHYIETVAGHGYRFKEEVRIVSKSVLPVPVPVPLREGSPPVGALPPESRFYIERPTDEQFQAAIKRQDSLVLVKGARQTGKSSLLARALQRARESGATVVFTDFQSLNAGALASADKLLYSLAEKIAGQMDLDFPPPTWKQTFSPNTNFETYLRREVLPHTKALVWGIDEVDRISGHSYSGEIFGLFRSWHNLRSLEPGGPWRCLTLALAYATAAHLFIKDLNQSPFNVGTRLILQDFTLDQIIELNDRYGSPLQDGQVSSYFKLLEGHPFLVHFGLYKMVSENLDFEAFEAQADRDDGPFGDHLRNMLSSLERDPELCEALRAFLRGEPGLTTSDFYRLRSAGVLTGDSPQEAKPRCKLYLIYLKKRLL
jgi:hypothetical protein